MTYRTSWYVCEADEEEAAAHARYVWGAPPPAFAYLSQGLYLDSHLIRLLRETWQGLSFALDGRPNDGVPDAVDGAGHDHSESPEGALPWLPVASWPLWTGLGGGGVLLNSSSPVPILRAYAQLPQAISRYVFRARVRLDSTLAAADLGATISLKIYLPGTPETVAIDPGALSAYLPQKGQTLGASGVGVWLESSPVDLSGLSLTDGKRIAVVEAQASLTDTAGVAEVYEIQIAPDPLWAWDPGADLPLDLSGAEAARPWPEAEALDLLFEAPRRLRDLTFGATAPGRTLSVPHDHGEGRGERIDRHQMSAAFGPHNPEGGGATEGGTLGTPLWRTASGTAITTSTPKIAQWLPLPVQGGISSVRVRVMLGLAGSGSRSMTLIAEARARGEAGRATPGDAVATLSYSVTGSTVYADQTAELDLSPLGATDRDRLLDLVLWQASEPGSTLDHRLLCVLVSAEEETLIRLDETQGAEAVAQVAPISLRAGAPLGSSLAGQAARTVRQVVREVLGGVPGLDSDGQEDRDDPWRREIPGPHQHRGSYERDGVRIDDGALVRLPLATASYARNIAGGDEITTGLNTTEPPRGQKLPGAVFRLRIPCGQGMTSAEISALIQPATSSPSGRLWLTVQARHVSHAREGDGTDTTQVLEGSILLGLAAGEGAQASGVSSAGGISIVVDPEPAPGIWASHRARAARGLGSWTRDALLAQPEAGYVITHAALWTEPVRLILAPTRTGDLLLEIRGEIQTGAISSPGSGTVDADARLLAVVALPGRGI